MRTWADIRFEALAANLAALRRRLPSGSSLLLPVKADAYGHGALEISRWAEDLGVAWLGVASVEEAVELREGGVVARILLFGPLPPEGIAELAARGVTPTLCSLEEAMRWARAAPGRPAHLEIDTGMGRAGFDWRRLEPLLCALALPGLELEAAYTHFASAETDPVFTAEQDARFRVVLAELARHGGRVPLVHLSNSAALFHGSSRPEGLARPGIAAYGSVAGLGLPPAAAAEFRPVLEWWAPVVQVRDLEPGDTVGYGCEGRVEARARGALLAVGYGDGYPRSQAREGFVRLRGRPCPLLGRISMDLTMVDATRVPDVAVGDAALLLGEAPGLTADDLASRSGTIGYEILTGIRRRVRRAYVRKAASREAEPVPRGAVQSA